MCRKAGQCVSSVSCDEVKCGHTEWLLLENQEDGVNQLNVLGEVVELVILLACAQLLADISA